MPGSPHLFGVTVYDTDAVTGKANIQVTIRNETSNESSSKSTNSNGRTVFNLANASVFTKGWTPGDRITYFVLYQGYEASESVIVQDTGGTQVTLTLVALAVAPTLRYFTVQDFLDYFDVSIYDEDNANGIKPQVIVKVGEMIEKEIEQLTYRTWDDNNGSNYTATDEYHNSKSGQRIWWTKFTPVVSVTNFYVNSVPEGSEASWSDLKADDDDDLNINLSQGRIQITSGADDWPEPGKDQVKITYTYGQSTPADIKKLAILMTGRAFAGRTLQRMNISASEVSGLSSAIQNLSVDDEEIKRILQTNSFPPIGGAWN